MKSKSNSLEVITKEYLKKQLSKFPTKEELKKELKSLERRFDFKLEGFKEEIDENAKKYRYDVLTRFEKVNKEFEKVDDNAREYRDNILTKLDEVMSELETGRQERTLETHQYSEIVEKVDDHEKRIIHMEETQKAA